MRLESLMYPMRLVFAEPCMHTEMHRPTLFHEAIRNIAPSLLTNTLSACSRGCCGDYIVVERSGHSGRCMIVIWGLPRSLPVWVKICVHKLTVPHSTSPLKSQARQQIHEYTH